VALVRLITATAAAGMLLRLAVGLRERRRGTAMLQNKTGFSRYLKGHRFHTTQDILWGERKNIPTAAECAKEEL
jgi:hypothetical protein